MVTVQRSPSTKFASGLSVHVVGPPLTAAVWPPLIEQVMSYQVPVTLTGSLKVIVTFAFTAAPASSSTGVVETTVGAASAPVVRGLGVAAVKSSALSSVSVAPLPARKSARTMLIVGAAPPPSKKFAPDVPVPYPTRSTILASAAAGHGVEPPLQPRGVSPLTSATLPAPAAIAIGSPSVMFGSGSGAPLIPPDSMIRMYAPAFRV